MVSNLRLWLEIPIIADHFLTPGIRGELFSSGIFDSESRP